MEARHRSGDHGSVIEAEKEALPHAGMNVVERAWGAVEVRVQGRCVGPEVVADGRCPVEQAEAGLKGFLVCFFAGLVFDLPV